jgi:hypothetical protein
MYQTVEPRNFTGMIAAHRMTHRTLCWKRVSL